MNRSTVKRILYGAAAAAFLGMAAYELWQGGFSNYAALGLALGVVMGLFAFTGG